MKLTLLLLVACGPPTIDGPSGAAGDDASPSEYSWTPETEDSAPYDEAALTRAMQAAIELALSLDASPVLDGYFEMIERADDDCPQWYEQDGNVFWQDYCTADDGTLFDGYGFYYPYEQADLDGSGTLFDGHYLYGVATITGADGTRFHTGGGLTMLDGYNQEYNGFISQSQLQGGFEWTQAESGDSWMADGLVPDLYLYSVDYPDYDARGVYVDGGIGGLSGDASAAIFSQALLFDEALGSVCTLEPTGSAQVRDSDGGWWLVVFDTPEAGDMDDELCDGCGTVSYEGTELGSVCVDFSSWLEWEVRPW